MKTISTFFTCSFLLLLFAGFTEVKVQHSKLSFVSTFYNNGTITIPYVEISDNNGSDNASNISANSSVNLILSSSPSGTVEITVQIPANHPKGRVNVKRGNVAFNCYDFGAGGNGIIVSLFDNSPNGDSYTIIFDGLLC
ncbi:MAG: hypothetical protein KA530_11455 [Ferruginibacter sp.]|nr:hypothetical protein [Ferruginibacter sp.]